MFFFFKKKTSNKTYVCLETPTTTTLRLFFYFDSGPANVIIWEFFFRRRERERIFHEITTTKKKNDEGTDIWDKSWGAQYRSKEQLNFKKVFSHRYIKIIMTKLICWMRWQVNRPLAMKKEGIQTRKRKPKAGTSSGAPTEKSSNKSIQKRYLFKF